MRCPHKRKKDNPVWIHQWHLQLLMSEIYNTNWGLNPVLWWVFLFRKAHHIIYEWITGWIYQELKQSFLGFSNFWFCVNSARWRDLALLEWTKDEIWLKSNQDKVVRRSFRKAKYFSLSFFRCLFLPALKQYPMAYIVLYFWVAHCAYSARWN